MKRIVLAAAAVGLMLAGATASASADAHHSGGPNKTDPPCTINPSPAAVGETYIVSVAGLPLHTAINIWVTDSTGTVGRPLGSTPDGTFNLEESSQVAGTTTYTFSGPVKNNNTQIYSTCSVDAS